MTGSAGGADVAAAAAAGADGVSARSMVLPGPAVSWLIRSLNAPQSASGGKVKVPLRLPPVAGSKRSPAGVARSTTAGVAVLQSGPPPAGRKPNASTLGTFTTSSVRDVRRPSTSVPVVGPTGSNCTCAATGKKPRIVNWPSVGSSARSALKRPVARSSVASTCPASGTVPLDALTNDSPAASYASGPPRVIRKVWSTVPCPGCSVHSDSKVPGPVGLPLASRGVIVSSRPPTVSVPVPTFCWVNVTCGVAPVACTSKVPGVAGIGAAATSMSTAAGWSRLGAATRASALAVPPRVVAPIDRSPTPARVETVATASTAIGAVATPVSTSVGASASIFTPSGCVPMSGNTQS